MRSTECFLQYADSTQVVITAANKGAVSFSNSAFWGPANQIAKVHCHHSYYVLAREPDVITVSKVILSTIMVSFCGFFLLVYNS